MTAPYIPVPVAVGFCPRCAENVAIDARGRCTTCYLLAIWPEGRPRPPMVTETLIRLQDAARIEPGSAKGRHRPLNARQLRVVK